MRSAEQKRKYFFRPAAAAPRTARQKLQKTPEGTTYRLPWSDRSSSDGRGPITVYRPNEEEEEGDRWWETTPPTHVLLERKDPEIKGNKQIKAIEWKVGGEDLPPFLGSLESFPSAARRRRSEEGGFIEGEESDQIEGWDYKKREKRRDSAKKMAEGYLSTSEGHSQRQRRLSARVSFKKEAGKWDHSLLLRCPHKKLPLGTRFDPMGPTKTPRPEASHYKSISRG